MTNTSLAHGYLIKARARLKTLPVLMGEQVLRPRPYGRPGLEPTGRRARRHHHQQRTRERRDPRHRDPSSTGRSEGFAARAGCAILVRHDHGTPVKDGHYRGLAFSVFVAAQAGRRSAGTATSPNRTTR